MKFIRLFVMSVILVFLVSCNGSSNGSKPPVYYNVIVDGVSQSVLEGTTAVEPELSPKEGYTFDKWISNGVEFSFDTIIYQDYVVESKWVLILDDSTEEMKHLQGGYTKKEDKFVSKTDGSIGLLKNLRMNQGRFNFTVKGEGGYGVYFDLDKEQIKRGHPIGNYYALKVDSLGNMYLIRAIDGHEIIVQASIVLKDEFDSQSEYNFEILKENKRILVYYDGAVVMSYFDNLPLEGYGIAFTADKKDTEFKINKYSFVTSAFVIDGVLNFADASKHDQHVVVIDGAK